MTVNNLAPHTGGGEGGPLHRRRRPGAARRAALSPTRRSRAPPPTTRPTSPTSPPSSRSEPLTQGPDREARPGPRLPPRLAARRRPRRRRDLRGGQERAGELNNTVFVFTSDNGLLQGQHRLGGKNVPYEEGIHMPLVMLAGEKALGAEQVGRVRELTANVDLAPTILDLARAKPCARPGNCRDARRALAGAAAEAARTSRGFGDDREILIEGGKTAQRLPLRGDPDRGPRLRRARARRGVRRLRSRRRDRALRPDRRADRRRPTRASSTTSPRRWSPGLDEPRRDQRARERLSRRTAGAAPLRREELPLTPFGSWPASAFFARPPPPRRRSFAHCRRGRGRRSRKYSSQLPFQ